VLENPDRLPSQTVSSRLVHIRLGLAGFSPSTFELAGADHVTVTRSEATVPDEHYAAAIRTALAERFGLDADDLDVRLVQPPTPRPNLVGVDLQKSSLEPVLPLILPLGRTRIPVAILVGHEVRQQVAAPVEVALYTTATTAATMIGRGETLTPNHVISRRMRVVGPVSCASADQILGRRATRTLRPGETIRPQDVEALGPDPEEGPVLVKARDNVRVVARKAGLSVTLSAAEALQNGRRGDTIRVRNRNSQNIITGRVVGPGELEVAL
jgi:flagella basal body P-ring formation protein FlgA